MYPMRICGGEPESQPALNKAIAAPKARQKNRLADK
jgi:hypothetical protein